MLDVRPLDTSPAGIEETCELLQAVYPRAHHITTDYLNRLYNGNPLGPTFGFSAFEAGTLVGHYLMIPLVTKIHGVEEQGIWPFQLATRPGFRGKGLFSALVEQSFDAARERGYGHLVGVANDMSTPIFVRKWDFLNIRPLDVKLGFGPIPDREGDSEEAGLQLERVWNSPGIGWRLGHPAAPYRMRRRGQRVDLFAPTGRFGIWAQIASFDHAQLPETLPDHKPAHPLRLWIGCDPRRNWSSRPYFDLPDRFRASPLNLLFYDLTDQGRTFDPDRVQYEVFDFDAY